MEMETEDSKRREPVKVARVYEQDKAGVERCEAHERVTRGGIASSAGNSGYDEQEERKEERVRERVSQIQQRLKELSPLQINAAKKKVNETVAVLEATRDLSRVWLHVDMDMFYAACEIRANEKLRDIPFAVGGMGMISTASYHARRYGVRSAMPGYMGRRLCEHLVFVKPDFRKYTAAAGEVREILAAYDKDFIAAGLDESYLDVTDIVNARLPITDGLRIGSGVEDARVLEVIQDLANEIRVRVQETTNLTCSIGAAANRMLAKVCSDHNKPNGVTAIAPNREAILKFVAGLRVNKISGIGRVTSALLRGAFGIETCEELLREAHLYYFAFSQATFTSFLKKGLGMGATEKEEAPQEGEIQRKGISCERTFSPTQNELQLKEKLRDICRSLANDLRENELRARHVTLKMKTHRFEQFTRSKILSSFIGGEENSRETADKIFKIAVSMFADAFKEKKTSYRLLGVRLANFYQSHTSEPGQRTLDLYAATGDAASGDAFRDNAIEDEPAAGLKGDENWSFTCAMCGAQVDKSNEQEHADFHLALSLETGQTLLNLPSSSARAAQSRKQKQKTIQSMFNAE